MKDPILKKIENGEKLTVEDLELDDKYISGLCTAGECNIKDPTTKDSLLELENKRLRKENEELKHYEYYYKAVFADTFNGSENNAYFENLKILFTMYMDSDDKLSKGAISLKYQLYAFAIFIANYIKTDEFYGEILRHMLYDSKNFTNNLEDYSELKPLIQNVINMDSHKLLKKVIEENEIREYI